MIRRFTSVSQKKGELGEMAAVEYMKKQGFHIVERNVSSRYGEIDIVAKKGNRYYFYEVKSGYRGASVHPMENMTPAKVQKIRRCVGQYCRAHRIAEYGVLVVLVLFSGNNTIEPSIVIVPFF